MVERRYLTFIIIAISVLLAIFLRGEGFGGRPHAEQGGLQQSIVSPNADQTHLDADFRAFMEDQSYNRLLGVHERKPARVMLRSLIIMYIKEKMKAKSGGFAESVLTGSTKNATDAQGTLQPGLGEKHKELDNAKGSDDTDGVSDTSNFWDFRRARRVEASMFLSGLFYCPRLTLLYIVLNKDTFDFPGVQQWLDLQDRPLYQALFIAACCLAPHLVIGCLSWMYITKQCVIVLLLTLKATVHLYELLCTRDLKVAVRMALQREVAGLWLVMCQLLLFCTGPWVVCEGLFYVSLVHFLLDKEQQATLYRIATFLLAIGNGNLRPVHGGGGHAQGDGLQRVVDCPIHYPPPLAIPDGLYTSEYVPQDYLCPIMRELMTVPVVTPSGCSYELSALQKWVERRGSDPQTMMPLAMAQVYPNLALRSMIEQWAAARASAQCIE